MTHCLNLSPKYAPGWGPWEVAREVVCNALDACDDPKIETNGTDELVVTTPTVPDLSELFVIGEGTKAPGGKTIGQFGEGIKMAALVATRTHGGGIVLDLPGRTVAFSFQEVLGVEALHATVSDNPIHDEGYRATVRMPGVALAFAGRILPDKSEGPLERASQTLRVYCKGVYVRDIDGLANAYDWNLNGLAINRDRSMVEKFQIAVAVASWLDENGTDGHAERLMSDLECWEARQPFAYWCSASGQFVPRAAAAFRRLYGEKAVCADTDESVNEAALKCGHRPVRVPVTVALKLALAGVKSASGVLAPDFDLDRVDHAPYRRQIERLRRLDPVVCAPGFSVSVFANRKDSRMGMAVCDDNRIWINESLFAPGNEMELAHTYLHETAHLISGARDCTAEFEFALGHIAGRLATALLKEPGFDIEDFEARR